MGAPVKVLNNSDARCAELPLPTEAKFSLPGRDLAKAMNSCTVCTPSEGGTVSTSGSLATIVIGVNSWSVLYGSG